jgi:hypothetical protein
MLHHTLGNNAHIQVENLEKPWGTCESEEMEYYIDYEYSVATCNLNCLNRLVREKCQCRDVYMPKGTNSTVAGGLMQYNVYGQCIEF